MALDNLRFAAFLGRGFSLSERVALQKTCRVLQERLHYCSCIIWGKIYGCQADYIIVRCTKGPHVLIDEEVLFSTDGGLQFATLGGACDWRSATLIDGPFIGDPAYKYCFVDPLTQQTVRVTERVRLFSTVQYIDFHCRLVPRGAVVSQSTGTALWNERFEGLSGEATKQRGSFLHLRFQHPHTPEDEVNGAIHVKKEPSKIISVENLDTAADDVPEGCWTSFEDPMNNLLLLQSLVIPGALFFMEPNTATFGNLYVGDGIRNRDLVFML